MILAESPRRQRVTKLVNWGHWFALANIVIALIIATIYIFSSPMPGAPLGTFFLLANWFGHIGFLTFFGFVIFILPLCYLDVSQRTIKASASIIAALGLALLAFDALLYNRTGFHLSHTTADLLKNEAHTEFSRFGWQQWIYLSLLYVVWLGFQLVLANAIFNRIDRLVQHKIAKPILSFFVVCFVSSHAIHVWADAQLYQPVIKQDNMFPLSYPATAKTTMSRYGLLDLTRYEERKQLQFDPNIHQISYPAEPVYCAIEKNKHAILLVQTDAEPLSQVHNYDLRQIDHYYTMASTTRDLISTTLFGVPEIYQNSLRSETPVLLDLVKAYGLPVSVMTKLSVKHKKIAPFVVENALPSHQAGLQIGFMSGAQITQFLTSDILQDSLVMIATGYSEKAGPARGVLYTNMEVTATMASTEDLAPTLLNAMGCNAPVKNYSTGQNLLAPSRNWLVSTADERIIVMHNNQQIEVLSNGSYNIVNIDDKMRSDEKLNVDLLSQAIKHLTHFSQ
jgi:membrane-anchored protein YejM (alkaline phosphatase superfamily)